MHPGINGRSIADDRVLVLMVVQVINWLLRSPSGQWALHRADQLSDDVLAVIEGIV